MKNWQKSLLFLCLSGSLTLVCCGLLEKKGKGGDAGTSSEGYLPADWDGLSDWNGSDFEVMDDK